MTSSNLISNEDRGILAGAVPEESVAIVVLTYNHEAYIGACLQSILAAGQPNWGIWVLDDGSQDATASIVRDYCARYPNIRLRSQPHSGTTSRNSQRLVDWSEGDYVVLMSGDDLFGLAGGLAHSVEALAADPGLALVLPRMVYLQQDPSMPAPPCHKKSLAAALRSGDPATVLNEHLYRTVSRIFLQGMVIRRSCLLAAGGFDEEVLADDYALVLRLFRHLRDTGQRFLFDEQNFWLYRVHSTNMHKNPARQFTLIAQVVQKYIPPQHWAAFRWDAVPVDSWTQWKALRDIAIEMFGAKVAEQALAPSAKLMSRRAAKRGEVLLTSRILLRKGAGYAQRVRACWHLFEAIGRYLLWSAHR